MDTNRKCLLYFLSHKTLLDLDSPYFKKDLDSLSLLAFTYFAITFFFLSFFHFFRRQWRACTLSLPIRIERLLALPNSSPTFPPEASSLPPSSPPIRCSLRLFTFLKPFKPFNYYIYLFFVLIFLNALFGSGEKKKKNYRKL